MANLITGIEIIVALADLLNEICRTEGGIRRNDPRIWNDYLHNFTEDEWQAIVTALDHIHQEEPGTVYPQDSRVIESSREALKRARLTGKSFVGTPMNPRSGNKTLAWQLTMTVREVANRVNGVHIPNRPGKIADVKDLEPKSTYDTVFEQE